MPAPDAAAVRSRLMQFQDDVCAAVEALEPRARFSREELPGPAGTLARPRVLVDGDVIEKAGVNFTHARGTGLSAAATERRPELAGRPFEAVSTSLIVHPRNPHAPTSHANLRWFRVEREDAEPVWWFGGGFDLTPCYAYLEDVVHWHREARAACEPTSPELYAELKKACDDYFFLPHRGETRGVGGLFFDDYDRGGFDAAFALIDRVATHYLRALVPVLGRRVAMPWTERERQFQLYRRGRYVEFNLLYDRGTRYGLQSGRRVESVLVSMPPLAAWSLPFEPEPDSPEARLVSEFLVPRNWLDEG